MRNRKQFISLLLMLALLLGMIPGVAVSALAEEIEIEGDLPEEIEFEGDLTEELPTEVEFDLAAPALRTGAAPTETGTAEDFLTFEDGNEPLEKDVSKLNGTNWMSGIRGDAYLNDFNIPYTHDAAMKDYIYHWGTQSSGAFFGQGSYCKTQYLYIPEQLKAGVRILDLRLNNRYETRDWVLGEYYQTDDLYHLYLCHGKNSSGGTFWAEDSDGDWVTFERVCKYVRDFLTEHPTETVILDLSIETQNNDKYGDEVAKRTRDWLHQMFYLEDAGEETWFDGYTTHIVTNSNYLINPGTGKPYIYIEPGNTSWLQPYTHMPQLKDCRGQVVVMYQAHQFEGRIGGMKRSIVGDVDILGGSNSASDIEKVAALESDFRKNGPNDLTLPMPGEHRDLLRIVDTNSHADEFLDYALVAFDDMHPLAIADYVHPKVFGDGLLLSKVGKYYGWVKMDGATEKDCRYIWKTNFPDNYEKSSTVTVTAGDASEELGENQYYAAHFANYEDQVYKNLVTGSYITIPGNIYDVQKYRPGLLLDRWEVTLTNDEGNPEKRIMKPGETYGLPSGNTTFTPVYRDLGLQTFIQVNWQDSDNADGLRPGKLDVICTYLDENGVEQEETIAVTSSPRQAYDQYYRRTWVADFIGDLKSIRPSWVRIPTDESELGRDTDEFYRYDEITGEPGGTMVINLVHTSAKTRTLESVVTWDDHDDADHLRPESVTLYLYQEDADGVFQPTGETRTVKAEKNETTETEIVNGEEVTTTVVTEVWKTEFPDCQAYRNGRAIRYRVDVAPISEYFPRYKGMSIENYHEAKHTVKRAVVKWVDSDDVANIRPKSAKLKLMAREKGSDAEFKQIGDFEFYANLSWQMNYIEFWGPEYTDDVLEYTVEPYEVEGYNAVWEEKMEIDLPYYEVTYTLKPETKPAALESTYKSGYSAEDDNGQIFTESGEKIGFERGTYIKDDVMTDPVRMVGEQELTWIKYDNPTNATGKHQFKIGDQQISLWDTNHNRPWGIRVSAGKGTIEDPYTFTVLHDEAINYYVGAYDSDRGLVKFTKHTRSSDYTLLTSDITALEDSKWYVFDGSTVVVQGSEGNPDITYHSPQLQFDHRVTVNGTVNLILRNNEEGKHLIFDKGIEFAQDAVLNIYQERLNHRNASVWVYGRDGNAGIDLSAGGALILHGGIVHAYTYSDGYAAIGGNANGQDSGSLTVYGNWVYAEVSGSTIPSASSIGPGVDVTVYGGGVNAEGRNGYNAIVGGTITVGEGIAVYKDHFDRGDDPDDEYLSEWVDGDYVRTKDMTIREGHLHEFTYSSEGDTITATCSKESCGHKTFTLTLVKPEKTNYLDALLAEATLKEGWEDFARATHLNITIQYYLREGSKDTVLEAAPEKAGDYKAVVNLPVDNAVATVYYTIGKAKVDITPPTASGITYGKTLADSTLTKGVAKVGDTDVVGTFAWANPRTQPAVSDSETTEYTVSFTPADTDNYEPATCKVTVKVNPADQNDTAPKALNPTYNGEEQALVSKGTADHGVMKYALGDTAPDAATVDDWQYTVPAATDAGDYKVWYKVFSGDPNYSDTEPDSVTAKIEKADSSGTVTGIVGLVYNTAEHALVIPGEHVGGELQYFVGDAEPTDENQWENEIPTETNAGDYTVWYRVKGDGNHNNTEAASVEVNIAKAVVKVSKPPVASAITYGQKLENSTLTGGDWLPRVDGRFEWREKATAPAVADSARTQYEVTFVPEDSNNYEADKSYATVVVVPADPTVTSPAAISPLVESGEAQKLVTQGSAQNGTMKYALGKTAPKDEAEWSESVPTGTETGDYTVWYKVFGNTNYNDTEAVPLYVTIYPAQSAVTPDTLVYNGEAQKLVVPGTVVGGTLQYFVGDDAPTDASQWKDDIPTRTDAGDYKVWYRVKGDANHNDVEPGSVTATIAKAPITPGVSITGWTYGEEANKPAVTGNPGNGEVTVTYSAEKEGTYTTAVPTQAGSWFVKAEVAETRNYQAGTAYPVSFAIAKVNVSIFADNKSGVYGDALQTLTWRLGGKTVNGDDLGVTLSTTAKADSAPGDYPITVKWNGNKNYSATVVDGVYTVGKRPVTVAAADQTVREGEQIATGVDHATATGLVEGHVLSAVTLAADGSAIQASGAKIVDAKGTDVTANYAVSYAAGKLNVQQPGTPVVFPPAAKELTYNGKAQALVSAGKAEGGTMQYSADNKTWSEKLPTGTDAGEYTVWYRVKGDADNGDVAASSLKVTIAKAAPKVTAPTAEKLTYTGNAQALVSAGEVEGGKLLYSTDNKTWSEEIPTGTEAGGYDVYYKVEGDKNHSDAAAKRVKVTIAERKASPDYTLLAKMTTSGSTKLKLSWSKVQGAQGYDVFFKNCDGKQNYTRVTITSERSYTITGLKKRKAYKAYVVAWKMSGDRKYYIGDASPIVHAITGGYTSKWCNAKSVKLSKSSLTLKVGKSETLKTSVKGVKSGRKVLQHARLVRYYSSDANVAKVNKNGKITAVGKGSCTVYAVANNGVRSKVTVKVN